MAPGTKRFKNRILAFSDDIPAPDREKYKRWVQYNGGTVLKPTNDTITHYVISKRDFRDYTPLVKAARRKRTIYLMKPCWVGDSLTPLNKSKSSPLDERDKKYTWELEHAKRVIHHLEKEKVQKRRELARAKRLAAKEDQEYSGDRNNDIEMVDAPSNTGGAPRCDQDTLNISQIDEAKADLNKMLGNKTVTDRVRKLAGEGYTSSMAQRFQQVLECGLKFDRSILETERNMALAGHRPYVDPDGRVHLIMLVRNDINKMAQEQYQLKSSSVPIEPYCKPGFPADLDEITATRYGSSQHFDCRRGATRFRAGKDTQLRYFEDPLRSHRPKPLHARKSIDKLNDGQCTPTMRGPRVTELDQIRQAVNEQDHHTTVSSMFHRPEQNVPFSSIPVVSYTPLDTIASSQIRVSLPRPFAYSLQMYESINHSMTIGRSEKNDSSVVSLVAAESLSSDTKSKSTSSFTEYLPKFDLQSQQTPLSNSIKFSSAPMPTSNMAAITSQPPSDSVEARPPPTKTYIVICQYTRKGTSRASELTTLAPEGSTFEFALDMFRKFFRKKTGLRWEDMTGNGSCDDRDMNRNKKGDSVVSFGAAEPVGLGGKISAEEEDKSGVANHSSRTVKRDAVVDIKSDNSPTAEQVTESTIKNTSPSSTSNTSAIDSTPAQTTTTANPPTTQAQVLPPPEDPTQSSTPSPSTTAHKTEPNPIGPVTGTGTFATQVSSSPPTTIALPSRPFTFVRTDQKVYVDGNKKYKAAYGEDLFVFRCE